MQLVEKQWTNVRLRFYARCTTSLKIALVFEIPQPQYRGCNAIVCKDATVFAKCVKIAIYSVNCDQDFAHTNYIWLTVVRLILFIIRIFVSPQNQGPNHRIRMFWRDQFNAGGLTWLREGFAAKRLKGFELRLKPAASQKHGT